jgi:hypothetical protein
VREFLAGLPLWARVGLFGLVYFAGAELGNVLSFQPGNVATFWPPAGLFVAVLLLNNVPRNRHQNVIPLHRHHPMLTSQTIKPPKLIRGVYA